MLKLIAFVLHIKKYFNYENNNYDYYHLYNCIYSMMYRQYRYNIGCKYVHHDIILYIYTL